MPLLSASMIVRDEAAHIGDCLESLRDIVDEVVVVDTGSTDGTVVIAESMGTNVFHHEWHENFAEARNVSLEHVTGTWILYIDADERLTAADRPATEALLTDAEEAGFRLLLRPVVDSTPYREYRLWRNDPRIRFEGYIHEKVVPAIHRVADEDGRCIGEADFLIEHVGYEGDQTRKHRRNLPLLLRQLDVEPGNLFAWHHLARVYDGLGDPEAAERTLRQAVAIARTGEPVHPVAVLSYADLVWKQVSRGLEAEPLLGEARSLFPENCVLLWIEARLLIARGEYDEALARLDAILTGAWDAPGKWVPSYSRQLVGEWPNDAKGLCHFRMGRYAEAADAYEAAAVLAPHNPAYPVKCALSRSRRSALARRSAP